MRVVGRLGIPQKLAVISAAATTILIGLLEPRTAAAAEVQQVCAGSPVPAGWLVADEYWSPTQCGSPMTTVDNMWALKRLGAVAVGKTLTVCTYVNGARQAVPTNFKVASEPYNINACGQPKQPTNNTMIIVRLN